MSCKACEIERNDEQVKQLPEHTCGKDGPVERAQPKTAMTQSDAPNEGREEKTDTIEWAKLKYQVGEILVRKFLEYNDGKFHTGLEFNPATHELTEFFFDQLSKERENFDKMHRASLATLNELQKEREMRKELVGLIEDMRLNYTESNFEDYNYKINSLLEKASELDKNKET